LYLLEGLSGVSSESFFPLFSSLSLGRVNFIFDVNYRAANEPNIFIQLIRQKKDEPKGCYQIMKCINLIHGGEFLL
jgi:hypothetical protein